MSDTLAVLKDGSTSRAFIKVQQYLFIRLDQQLAIEIRVQKGTNLFTGRRVKIDYVHAVWPPVLIPYDCASPDNLSLNIARPLLRRDITVPIGTFRISDTSL